MRKSVEQNMVCYLQACLERVKANGNRPHVGKIAKRFTKYNE